MVYAKIGTDCMKLHASTDDNGVTRFMIEHENGTRTCFEASVTDFQLECSTDYDTFDFDSPRAFRTRQTTTIRLDAYVLGEVTRVKTPDPRWQGPSADLVIVDEATDYVGPKELGDGEG